MYNLLISKRKYLPVVNIHNNKVLNDRTLCQRAQSRVVPLQKTHKGLVQGLPKFKKGPLE
jgi:hypothetical protein